MPKKAISVTIKDRTDYKVREVNLGVNRLVELVDVSAVNPVQDDGLFFDESQKKFVSKPVNIGSGTGSLDGGTF